MTIKAILENSTIWLAVSAVATYQAAKILPEVMIISAVSGTLLTAGEIGLKRYGISFTGENLLPLLDKLPKPLAIIGKMAIIFTYRPDDKVPCDYLDCIALTVYTIVAILFQSKIAVFLAGFKAGNILTRTWEHFALVNKVTSAPSKALS